MFTLNQFLETEPIHGKLNASCPGFIESRTVSDSQLPILHLTYILTCKYVNMTLKEMMYSVMLHSLEVCTFQSLITT